MTSYLHLFVTMYRSFLLVYHSSLFIHWFFSEEFCIEGSKIIDIPNGVRDYRHLFKLQLSREYNNREMYLCFDNAEECRMWRDAFEKYREHKTVSNFWEISYQPDCIWCTLRSRIIFFEKNFQPPALIRTPPFVNFLVFSEENNIFVTRFEIKKQPPYILKKLSKLKGKHPCFQ